MQLDVYHHCKDALITILINIIAIAIITNTKIVLTKSQSVLRHHP